MKFSSQKLALLIVLVFFLFSAAFFADAFHKRELELTYPELLGLPKLESHTSLPGLIKYVFVFTVTISGVIALGALVYAGFLFLMSGANPGLRATAKKKITDVLWGILLLLGAYIFFNTLNPDLTILRAPGTSLTKTTLFIDDPLTDPLGGIDPVIDVKTLKYGGVVVYTGDPDVGSNIGSQILLNNVTEFDDETWLGTPPKFIKVLGECAVSLFTGENYTPVPPAISITGPNKAGLSIDHTSLQFTNRGCLGSSITAYRETGYHDNSTAFIYSDSSLEEDRLAGTGRPSGSRIFDAEDNIGSVRFNRPDLADFGVKFCEKKAMGIQCANVSSANLDDTAPNTINGGIKDWSAFDFLTNDVSSFTLGGSATAIRQAGVVLYNKDDFSGISEIFINSDANLEPVPTLGKSNIMALFNEYTSSMRIVGEYIVTLFDCANYCRDNIPNGHYLRIYNNIEVPTFEQGHVKSVIGPLVETDPASELGGLGNRNGGVLEIPKLSAFVHPGKIDGDNKDDETWNDFKVKSMRIEVPLRIYTAQNLWMNPCEDPNPQPESDFPCVLP